MQSWKKVASELVAVIRYCTSKDVCINLKHICLAICFPDQLRVMIWKGDGTRETRGSMAQYHGRRHSKCRGLASVGVDHEGLPENHHLYVPFVSSPDCGIQLRPNYLI